MDAASNNSVDDIRELRENVALAPMQGGKRVYILDEAHMLSTAAWNAFLKTLEEPPAHVVFVLATTEAHKVPATIVDRCHRFDFQPPVARADRRRARSAWRPRRGSSCPTPPWACSPRAATGSFRDALGTLEQLVTYGGTEVKLDDVLDILGVADAELVLDAAEALADRDPKAALLTVQRLSDSGPRLHAVHARPLGAPAPPVRGPDARARSRTRSRSRPSTRTGWRPRPSASPQGEILRAIDFLAARDRRREGRLASRASSSRWRC